MRVTSLFGKRVPWFIVGFLVYFSQSWELGTRNVTTITAYALKRICNQETLLWDWFNNNKKIFVFFWDFRSSWCWTLCLSPPRILSLPKRIITWKPYKLKFRAMFFQFFFYACWKLIVQYTFTWDEGFELWAHTHKWWYVIIINYLC